MVNLNAQIEERNASAEWLAENGSPEAIAALLKRFSIRYEHAMKDTEEKLFIYAQLRSIGPNVVGPTKSWIEKTQIFAQPLKLIEEFEGKEATIQFYWMFWIRKTILLNPRKSDKSSSNLLLSKSHVLQRESSNVCMILMMKFA